MPGVSVPFGTTLRLGGPIRRSSDHRFLAPTRRISQLGTSFVGARAEPFPRQHVSHGPVGLAHVQDAYDRYQWTLCHRRVCASSALYPFPFDARARRGCTSVSERKTGCHSMQSPRLSEARLPMTPGYLVLALRPLGGSAGGIVDSGFETLDILSGDFSSLSTQSNVKSV